MLIAINPGHYSGAENYDPGACNDALGLKEVDVNLAAAALLAQQLESEGYEVVQIHKGELYEITEAANASGADLFVSIHCNSAANPLALGTETFFHYNSVNGQKLAQCIQAELVGLQLADRGVKCDSLYVTRYTNAVAVLVELGFLSNPDEGARLGTAEFQQQAADAICRGIDAYLG